jgi:hypothetical protein
MCRPFGLDNLGGYFFSVGLRLRLNDVAAARLEFAPFRVCGQTAQLVGWTVKSAMRVCVFVAYTRPRPGDKSENWLRRAHPHS